MRHKKVVFELKSTIWFLLRMERTAAAAVPVHETWLWGMTTMDSCTVTQLQESPSCCLGKTHVDFFCVWLFFIIPPSNPSASSIHNACCASIHMCIYVLLHSYYVLSLWLVQSMYVRHTHTHTLPNWSHLMTSGLGFGQVDPFQSNPKVKGTCFPSIYSISLSISSSSVTPSFYLRPPPPLS